MARKYKKGRISRKGKTSYDSYLEKRKKLENEGYTLRPMLSKEEFNKQKNNARLAGQKNFARQRASWDRYTSKANYYDSRKAIEALDINDPIQADVYNKYSDMEWSKMKKWDNKDWANFRDDLLESNDLLVYYYQKNKDKSDSKYKALSAFLEEFRGIYE